MALLTFRNRDAAFDAEKASSCHMALAIEALRQNEKTRWPFSF